MRSINPSTGEFIKEYPPHSNDEAATIISQTQDTWSNWNQSGFQERSSLMHRTAVILREDKEALAQLMTLEMGKIISEARAEIEKCAWVCEYYAEKAEAFLADEVVETNASRSFVSYAPIGIVLADHGTAIQRLDTIIIAVDDPATASRGHPSVSCARSHGKAQE